MKIILSLIVLLFCSSLGFTDGTITVARIHYQGGGDWYGNLTTFVNLFASISQNTNLDVADREVSVKIMDEELFKYPISYIAGHGNIRFSDDEVNRLRKYLINGGFLWADDDYGMDGAFRREMKKVFPDAEWVELPFSHPIYHVLYQFPNGLPKIHKHDGGPPKGLGLFYEGRMVVFYSLNTDISDGCEDPDIHEDPADVRQQALQMGTNIIIWALTQ
jgi:hypothetical protein